MKKLLLSLVALLSLSSCSYDKESVNTPLGWCVSRVLKDTTSYDGYIDYTYTEINSNHIDKREEIIKAYLITTYCYEQSYYYFVKTEWFCAIGYTGYYGFYQGNLVHLNDIEWIDCVAIEKTICNEGELESC